MQVFVSKLGQQYGPYSVDQLKQFISQQRFSLEDNAFYDGCEEWIPLSQVPGMDQGKTDPAQQNQAGQGSQKPIPLTKSEEHEKLEPESLFGQYKVTRLLGQGGMGEVYEVLHEVLGTRHALKLVHSDLMSQPGALDRFRTEGRAMAGLSHPGIVGVDDFGETEDRHWLRMELMEGREVNGQKVITLEDYVVAKGGRLPEEEAKTLLKEMLDALGHAHQKGLVHRDLKPANILFDGERVKISDFGLVNAAGADWMDTGERNTMMAGEEDETIVESSNTGSRSRALMGTYSFMSPEQKKGRGTDARSDLYAIGLMAFRMFTDRSPGFRAPSKIVEGLSTSWDSWLERALEEEPGDRFADALEMAEALAFSPEIEAVDLNPEQQVEPLAAEDQSATPIEPPPFTKEVAEPEGPEEEQPPPPPQEASVPSQNPFNLKLGLIAAGTGILVIILFFMLFSNKSPDNPEDLAEEVLQTFIDDDLDRFLEMTSATLALSQWDNVLEDLWERNISYLETELENADGKTERRAREDEIEKVERSLDYDVEFAALGMYLGMTLDDLDYDEWKGIAEDHNEATIEAQEGKIEKTEDKDEAIIFKRHLERAKDASLGKSDYNEWKEDRDRKKERWKDSFESIQKEGKALGINWEKVEFEYIDFSKEYRKEVKNYDIDLVFSYREENYKITMKKCIDTDSGILMESQPVGPQLIR